MLATWNGQTGEVIAENVGRVLVDFDGKKTWLIKGIPGLVLFERKTRGRPKKHGNNADKQRDYRERKAGKALRKYTKGGQQ